MPRARLQAYEIALISVPTALLLGGAAFLSRQQALREQDRNGPYRAEITRVEVVSPSPFEVWQGFDTKIVVRAKDLGIVKRPEGVSYNPARSLQQNIFLEGPIRGHLQKLPISRVLRAAESTEPVKPGPLLVRLEADSSAADEPEMSLTFLATTSGFDEGGQIRLGGDIWFEHHAYPNAQKATLAPGWVLDKTRKYPFFTARSTKALLSQPLKRVASVQVDRTGPPIQTVSADLLSPVYAHTSALGDNGSGIVRISFKPGSLPNQLPTLRCTAVQLLDARGRAVDIGGPRPASWDASTSLPSAMVRLKIENVPPQRGALTMKMWLALGDGWPTLIQTQVRPTWISKRAHTLQLQNVRVQGSNVIVDARYTGTSALRYAGPGPFHGIMQPVFFDQRDDTSLRLIPNVTYKRLYTHWSQHYVLPNGKSYWFSNNVKVQSVNCDASNQCRIVYQTNALNALKPGRTAHFFAQVGIEGDGFLPIHTTMTRPD